MSRRDSIRAILASLEESAREQERVEAYRKIVARRESDEELASWKSLTGLLREVDPALLGRITRRMINLLCWEGNPAAEELLREFSGGVLMDIHSLDENVPQTRQESAVLERLADQTCRVAERAMPEEKLIALLARWIREDRASFLISALEAPDAPFRRIRSALTRYQEIELDEADLSFALRTGLRVSLLRRFFTDQLDFINSAKPFVTVNDFTHLLDHLVTRAGSHGKLGGKSAGLFLASRVINCSREHRDLLRWIRVPRTWYVSSDGLLAFIRYNSLDDVYSRKYMEIEQIRQDYPQIVQVFKSSRFPPEMLEGLEETLHDLRDVPLIVRSSSLLEDRTGSAFSGKYKSLFLANRGSLEERLDALTDAIAEVYASIFGPDPIEYRAERGLLDVHEEMGVMIQEVVGKRVGKYFFPAYSGVAFSRNEFRWSPRIRREDGLIRLVPGLGTRAVDRLGDDYPILVAPGQPGLRANVTPEEVARYSPSKIDLINLETNRFETHEIRELIRDVGQEYPGLMLLVSEFVDGRLRRPSPVRIDFEKDDLVVTFDGLMADTPFLNQVGTLMKLLADATGSPVDLEFASDGESLYLLQCRPQSYSEETRPAPIPVDLPLDEFIFSAERYVSNGWVENIEYVVYVDSEGYEALETRAQLQSVARVVGTLNKILPRRRFVLVGPGRWGSRGDIRLGVGVTYSDINNAAMLIEIGWNKHGSIPDLSFGTHFFQDLVEADIRYLPLYPDDPGALFNLSFFLRSPNCLAALLPEWGELEDVVRVIDVPAVTGGGRLEVRMNAELDRAVALVRPASPSGTP